MRNGKKIDGIRKTAMDALMAHTWPGNVRELKSAFEFAFVSCPGGMIEAGHLPPQIIGNTAACNPGKGVPLGSLDDAKRHLLQDALDKAKGNRSEAARILGISRTSVWKQIKRYNIGTKG